MENEALSLQDRYVSSWKYGIFQEMFISKLVTMEICSKGAPEIKYSILTGRIRWREPGGRSQAPMNHGIMSDFFPMIWDLYCFLSWDDLALIFFWILVDAFEWFFLQWFAPRDVCFRWHHTTHLWSRVESLLKKKNNTKFSKLSATFGSLRDEKKSHSWKDHWFIAAKNEACRMLISPQPTPMCRHNLTSSTPGRREIPSGNKHISLHEKIHQACFEHMKPLVNLDTACWPGIFKAKEYLAFLCASVSTWVVHSKTSWNLACHARSTAVAMGPASTKWSSCMSGSFWLHIKQE